MINRQIKLLSPKLILILPIKAYSIFLFTVCTIPRCMLDFCNYVSGYFFLTMRFLITYWVEVLDYWILPSMLRYSFFYLTQV
jgi:hypothetical protein